jgi:hypothetical protein
MIDLRENEWYGDTLVSVDELRAENKQLRIMLALAYSGYGLYTDDGEFSCGKAYPAIDFKRMPVDVIKQCQHRRTEVTRAQLSKDDIEEIFNRR